MKYFCKIAVIFCLFTAITLTRANIIVNDTWSDGTRTDPTAANGYSENGTDADSDGSIESVWYSSSGSALTVPAAGDLRAVQPTGSLFTHTYFTPEGSEVNLAGAGDAIKVTWVFVPTTVNANNSSVNFPIALVNTPAAAPRRTSDASPNQGAYTGYAIFMNVGQTLGNATPFSLREWVAAGVGDLLGSAGNWGANGVANGSLANGATSGNHGFDSGTQYTFTMTLTRNASSGLDISVTMVGGTYNNSGTGTITYTDTTPNGFIYDTFAMRPSALASTFGQVDTSLFKVEYIPGATPPSIDSSPDDQTVVVGQNASFTTFASGSTPLVYQWYLNTNTFVATTTNNTLMLNNVQLSDAGDYFAIVTNSYGSATSAVATLTVNLPTAPSIVTQPQDLTVLPGQTATFNVSAGGSQPMFYQWYFDLNPINGATDSTLIITNSQVPDDGGYTVIVTNVAGSITSSNAQLTVNTTPVAPTFTTQPASIVALLGSTISFVSVASGTAPISYQWSRNGTPISGETSSTLSIANVQNTNAGSFTVTASNNVGSATSSIATLSISSAVLIPNSSYNLTGFGRLVTGGGYLPDTDPAYRKVTNALDLATAIMLANKTAGAVKVIEITTNLDLGWNEVGPTVQGLTSNPFRAHASPKLHPRLLTTGVSLIDIKVKNGGLTIFSPNGATIRHACFNVKSTANIIIRNLKFDEMWEWDESSKGNYDGNDWDFIDLGNGGTVSNIWIDHCTFTKAYDGQTDIKQGSWNITFSWCKYTGDDGATNANSWVRQQITSLESNKTSYAMYNFLRNKGFSQEDVVTVIQGHDKTHLIGANSLKAENNQHSVTFHHDWFINPWDRLPRLRGGNVHNYNIFADDTVGLAAKRLRDTRANAMTTGDRNTLNNTYSFNPFLNGSISTENGAVLIEKSVYKDCITPLRNNQTDPSNPTYTGKILALDTIYQFDSTFVRGNSTDPGNPLGPFQAPVIAFSWNIPGNQLPYSYTMDDPGQLPSILAAGAGAGAVNWNKTNWLLTAYAPTAPVITSQPGDQSIQTNQSATFVVVASGTGPLSYQWFYNTNTSLSGATNSVFTLLNAQSSDSGTYSVVITNSAGSVTSSVAQLVVGASAATGFTAWQQANFTESQLNDLNVSGPDASPAGDGVANFVKYALGLPPFAFASAPLFGFAVENGEGVLSYNRPASVLDVIYRIEVSPDLFDWTTNGVMQHLVGTNGSGLQQWEGNYTGPASTNRYFRFKLIK